MNSENREALRLFRDTVVRQSTPKEALDFYAMVLKGDKSSRQAWTVANVLDVNTLDPLVKAFLQGGTVLDKQDLAIILTSQAVAELKPTVTGLWAWSWWPWNWRWK
jgi:hypothetical protein